MIDNKYTFSDIESSLCTFCGTCVGICPNGALEIYGEKVIFKGHCSACGLCFKACPGIEVNFNALNNTVFQTEDVDRYIGYYTAICCAHAADNIIRENASSGGFVTALLCFLLEKGIIDGAIVVGTNVLNPTEPEIKIARTREEITSASQSKYSLVPVNSILREIQNLEGSFAFVGLPCHIHGLRKLQQMNRPEIKKICLIVGLFCGFNMHIEATTALLKKLGLKKEEVISLKYRSGGHPGGLLVNTENGSWFLDKHIYNVLNPVYIPKRCLLCPDLMSELADISVGDIWMKEFTDGWSSVIIRTPIGMEVVTKAYKNGWINCEKLHYDDLLSSHRHLIQFKKEAIYARMNIMNPKPKYNLSKYHYLFKNQLKSYGIAFILLITGSRIGKIFFSISPFWLVDSLAKIIDKKIRKDM